MAINKEKVIAAAQKYAEKGQYEKAAKEYLKIVTEDSRDVRVLLKLGDVYAKKGDKPQATESYLKVAALYAEQGFFQKAVAVYKQILRLDPRLVDVNFKLADLYKQLGLLSDAMQQYEMASNFFHREGRVSEALDALRHIVELDPENVASRIKLAEMYSKAERTDEAITEFARAADSLRTARRTDDFIKVAERLVFHQPDNCDVQRELAEHYIARNDTKRALPKLQACFKADPRDRATLSLLAQAFQELGQLSKTISVLKELARIHSESQQLDERDAVFRRILTLAPGDAEALAALAPRSAAAPPPPPEVAPETDDLEEVSVPSFAEPIIEETADTAEEVLEAGPSSSGEVSGVELVEVLDAEIEPSVEEGVAEEVARILTETDVYIKYGLYDKAQEHLRRVFERDPDNVEGHERLKELHVQVGDHEDAVAELMWLAQRVAAERPEDAGRFLREALELNPGYGPAKELLERLATGVPPRPPSLASIPIGLVDEEDTDLDAEKRDGELEVEVDTGAFAVGGEEIEVFDDASTTGPVLRFREEELARDEVLFDEDEAGSALEAGMRRAAPTEETLTGSPKEPPAARPSEAADEARSGLGSDDITPVAIELPVGDEDVIEEIVEEAAAPREHPSDYPRAAADEPTRAWDDLSGQPVLESEVLADDEALLAATSPAPRVATPIEEPPPARVATPLVLEAPAADGSLEDELDEADFFLQQGLLDQAREMLDDLLARHPNHPLIVAKRRELEELEPAVEVPAPAAPAPVAAAAVPPAIPPPIPPPSVPAARAAPRPPPPPEAGLVPETAAERSRRQVVEQQIDVKDFETHYDLGIAYKEMGLYNDAIHEFELIAQAPGREVLCHTMIGLCFSARGMQSEAISQFKKGLYVEGITDRESTSLYFELGAAYEKLADPREALYYYEKVLKRDPRFRDVEKRVAALRADLAPGGARNGRDEEGEQDKEPTKDLLLEDSNGSRS